jgi:hypothetical protein
MAECGKPLITYTCNVIVFGKVGVTAPIANALFTEKLFNEVESQDYSDLPAEHLCQTKTIDSVVYKVQLIDTYAQGKPVVSATTDVKRISKLCAQTLSEGINLAIFALSYSDIEEKEVEALTILLDNMDQSVLEEMAMLVVSVSGIGNFKKEKLLEIEDRLPTSEKTGVLTHYLRKRRTVYVPKTLDPDLGIDAEKIHQKMLTAGSQSTQNLKDILHSSREMWLPSELFQIKQVLVKQQSTGNPNISGQSHQDSTKQAARAQSFSTSTGSGVGNNIKGFFLKVVSHK